MSVHYSEIRDLIEEHIKDIKKFAKNFCEKIDNSTEEIRVGVNNLHGIIRDYEEIN